MYVSLQYFDAVGWVFWPVKTVSHITYTVLAGRKTLLHPSIDAAKQKQTVKNAASWVTLWQGEQLEQLTKSNSVLII